MLKEKHVFSFQTDAAVADKVGELVGYCKSNGVRASDGLVMRSLLLSAEASPDFLGLVRARVESEKQARRAAYRETTGKGAADSGKPRKTAKRR